ncbi:hypothetical protein ASF92_01240 [Pedobacter sp. Leaf176]|nr:hypothetical protein ASF92_01240 [Pedobacter sp. Leaf176]
MFAVWAFLSSTITIYHKDTENTMVFATETKNTRKTELNLRRFQTPTLTKIVNAIFSLTTDLHGTLLFKIIKHTEFKLGFAIRRILRYFCLKYINITD